MIQETFPMIVGGDEVPNERTLLTKVESGLMMSGADAVRFLIDLHDPVSASNRYDMVLSGPRIGIGHLRAGIGALQA